MNAMIEKFEMPEILKSEYEMHKFISKASAEAAAKAEAKTRVSRNIQIAHANSQGTQRAPKGAVKRAKVGKKVDLAQLLAAPVSRTNSQTIGELASEIKSIHAGMVTKQIDQVKSFSEMGIRFNKLLHAVMLEGDFETAEAANTAFGNKLKLLGIGHETINRPTRRAYIALAGKLTEAKKFVSRAVIAYTKNPKTADKITKSTALDYAQVKLTAPILAKRMGLLGAVNSTPPKLDTLEKIVDNVQNRVAKLDGVEIEDVIKALIKASKA